jgi:hypothetical protein
MLHEKLLVEKNEMLTLDTKKSIHINPIHVAYDYKERYGRCQYAVHTPQCKAHCNQCRRHKEEKKKNSKVLFDRLTVVQLLKTPFIKKNPTKCNNVSKFYYSIFL